MLLRDKVKSWAISEGDGGTSEATRLGQEAAFCVGVGCRGAGSDIQLLKKTMAPLHTSATQNTCPVYLEEEEMRG